ncbi:ABC transporter permease subunit, partial [Micromonospora aurantiaca]|nr:ABC transporter permease subunit [Micromonospora aurantiaca]
EGKRALDPGLLEMGRSFTRSRVRVLFSIELPLLVPYIFAAARLSFSVGWKVALIAEFFGSQTGLGLVMNRARQSFDSPTVFATIVVVLVI